MSTRRISLVGAAITCALFMAAAPVHAFIEFNSGLYEPVSTTIGDTIGIDYTTSFAPGTHVDLLTNGSIQGAVYMYNNAAFTLNGGSVYGRIFAHDDSHVWIAGGTISISDGNLFFGYESSIVEFVGSEFAVDGTPVGYGESLTDYAACNGLFYTGELTGILADESSITGNFFIYNNADMIVVPEPATLSLLVVTGAMALARRRRRKP